LYSGVYDTVGILKPSNRPGYLACVITRAFN
jgi:hypothetical protein